jgi:ATP-dependent helicase/DNAse subunit B
VISLEKNQQLLGSILKKATSSEMYGGLSPSGLAAFKDCSLKFYFRYGVHLKETEEVEESAEAGTFGSILHLSLEKLYTPFGARIIEPADLTAQLQLIDETVHACFTSFFDNKPVGKSILQQEVIKVYVKKLLKNDIRFITELKNSGQHLTLLGLEKEYSAPLQIDLHDGPVTIYIKGKIDRIDSYGGFTRVIDYKSSVKDSDKFVFESFDNLFHDKNYDKQLQLLIYAWLLFKNDVARPEQLRPGIVPFKVFSEEPKYILGGDKKPFVFSAPFLGDFETAMKKFISGIFDLQIPFSQTDDRKVCEYCAYNMVCNFHP